MKVLGVSVLAGVVFTGAMLTAQAPQQPAPVSANPLSDQIKTYFTRVKGYLTKSIEMVPAMGALLPRTRRCPLFDSERGRPSA